MSSSRAIDAIFAEATERKAIPGVVATAANAGGVVYEGAFGSRDLTTGAARTTDTVVWIASMTKAVTATAAMQLVERGKLSLDAPATAVVPDLKAAQVLEGFDAASRSCGRRSAPSRSATC